MTLRILARDLAYQGDAQAAVGAAKTAIDATAQLGNQRLSRGHMALALAALAAGDVALANNAISSVAGAICPQLAPQVNFHAAEVALASSDLDKADRYADLAVSSSTGWHLARALTTRARIAIARGAPAHAQRDAYEALANISKVQAYLGVPDTLECLAIAATETSATHAARLFGAAEAIRQTSGENRYPHYEAAYQAALASTRDTLGTDNFDNAWHEGAALSLDEAITYAQRSRREHKRPTSGWESLTPAEHHVIRLISQGLPNKTIAEKLRLSPRTVQVHLSNVYRKLGLQSRVQLAQEADRHSTAQSGLIDGGSARLV